jgi:hypothetical protein
MSTPNTELSVALADVRRGYRLLWAFQKRIFDYKKVIWERLGFTDWGGGASLLIPAGQTGNASWAQLPMADVEFRAYRHHRDSEYPVGKDWASYPKINDALLYIRVRPDTGMPLIVRNDPSPLAFASVELCQTKLQLFIVLNRLDRSQASHIWAASETCRTAPVDGEKAVDPPTIPGYSLFGEEVDLATLPDEGTLIDWIDAFKVAAEKALGVKFSNLPDA